MENEIILNADQSTALEYIVDWYENSDELFFSLIGSAGTGKTTTLKKVVESLDVRTIISAPTHKAVKVASDASDLPGTTIQALLGLRPNIDVANFNINFPVFAPIVDNKLYKYDLVVIDEASMINTQLFDYLIQESAGLDIKILFLGDSLQLPPVNEHISKVFSAVRNQYELTKIMRQASDNPLVPLLSSFRDSIIQNKYLFGDIMKNPKVIDDKGFVLLPHDAFEEALVNHINSGIEVKYLAWRNQSVDQTNESVRQYLYQTTELPQLNVGEPVIGYKTQTKGYNDSLQILTVNSEEYRVHKIGQPIINRHGVETIPVILKDVDNSKSRLDVVVHNQANIDLYTDLHEEKLRAAKMKRHWKTYYSFVENNILMTDVTLGRQLINKKVFDFGYGMTVHKSQGSTYDVVFVDYQDIVKNRKSNEMLKLLYVAASRARTKVYFKI